MYIYILDKNLKRIGLIDNYVSLIWTTRYYLCGDFELYLPVTSDFFEMLQIGYYLQTTESDYTMIIESIDIKTDAENGNYLTVSGRSVESLLDRRIVFPRAGVSNMTIEATAAYLIHYNFVSPTVDDRKIPEIGIFDTAKNFPEKITSQYFGDNVYETITQLCQTYGYGFRMLLKNGKFTFEMYDGLNRTRSQKENAPAVFSSEFENLVNTEYAYDIKESKNVALVAGQGEGTLRKTTCAGTGTGLERREIFVDARDLSNEELTDSEYITVLQSRGIEKLSEYERYPQYTGEVNNFPDYCSLGDIVEVENEFGMKATARIVEIIESYSTSGNTRIPTFDEWSV